MCSAFSFDVSIFSELLIVLQVRCFTGFHLGRDGYIHLSSKVDGFVSICVYFACSCYICFRCWEGEGGGYFKEI